MSLFGCIRACVYDYIYMRVCMIISACMIMCVRVYDMHVCKVATDTYTVLVLPKIRYF